MTLNINNRRAQVYARLTTRFPKEKVALAPSGYIVITAQLTPYDLLLLSALWDDGLAYSTVHSIGGRLEIRITLNT